MVLQCCGHASCYDWALVTTQEGGLEIGEREREEGGMEGEGE